MSHFYATIDQSARKTTPTAQGHVSTGIGVVAASWAGAVRVTLWYDEEANVDRFRVEHTSWRGAGIVKTIAEGIVGQE